MNHFIFDSSTITKLCHWFEGHARDLPWRKFSDPYRIWISEIMLQQTTVATVIPYYTKWIDQWPSAKALAQATEQDVLKAWSGLGYYSRAKNILAAAQGFEKNGFPQTYRDWLEVKGVGPYTAGAIASIALEQAAPIVDGNVKRVWARFWNLGEGLSLKEFDQKAWQYSQAWIEHGAHLRQKPSVLNQALMELGALVCTPRAPQCSFCPWKNACKAFKAKTVFRVGVTKPKKSWVHLNEKKWVILSADLKKVLVVQNQTKWRKGLWDFLDETQFKKIKLLRPIRSMESLITKNTITHHKIVRRSFIYSLDHKSKLSSEGVWLDRDRPDLPLGSGALKVLKALKKTLDETLS